MNKFDIRAETRGPKTGEVRPLADDILHGADQIAAFMYGYASARRKVYHLAEKSRLPVFRLGATLCARKSTLLEWIEQQEARASGSDGEGG